MSDYLPDRLILEILCRLPVESIIRCMCVCKQWCCLISSSHFINTHLSYSLSATSLLLIHHYTTTPNYKLHHTVYLDNPSTTQLNIFKKLHIPFESIPQLKIQFRALGFCNGLFCYIDGLFGETNAFVLWNPSIRKSLSLPIPPSASLDQNVPCKFYHGFGVDLKTREFKVARIAYAVEVYSLSSGLWKTLNTMDIHSKVVQSFGATNVCLNGTIYWVSSIKNNEGGSFFNSLLLFDLSNETFSEMCLPPGLVHVDPLNLHVALCGQLITVILYNRDELHDGPCIRCVVWVMNQCGELESWQEKFVVVLEIEFAYALGFRGNGELLLKMSHGTDLLSYDPQNKEFKLVDIDCERVPTCSIKYVESLLLPYRSCGAISDLSNDPSDFIRLNW